LHLLGGWWGWRLIGIEHEGHFAGHKLAAMLLDVFELRIVLHALLRRR
jgi:hypothetical protein